MTEVWLVLKTTEPVFLVIGALDCARACTLLTKGLNFPLPTENPKYVTSHCPIWHFEGFAIRLASFNYCDTTFRCCKCSFQLPLYTAISSI